MQATTLILLSNLLLLIYFIVFNVNFLSFGSTKVNAQQTRPPIKFMCAGDAFGCATFSNNNVKCWGNAECWGKATTDDYEGTGDSTDEIGDKLPYISISDESSSIEGIHCGKCNLCVRYDSGNIKCLGSNAYGQAGVGLSTLIIGEISNHVGDSVPNTILGKNIKALDASLGKFFTCAIVTGKKVKCYGLNISGALGINNPNIGGAVVTMADIIGNSPYSMGDNLTYVNLGTSVEVSSIHVGIDSEHSCVILSAPSASAQRIKCWGGNTYYNLGYGDNVNRGSNSTMMGDYLPLVDLGTESRVKQLALGWFYTCALLISNDLKCWGYASYGNLGSGSTTEIIANVAPVVVIDSGKTIKNISTGGLHTCISYTDNITIKCVGLNKFGALGQGDTLQRGDSPKTTFPNISSINLGLGGSKILGVYSGYYHTCTLIENNIIKCWGINHYGQSGTKSNKAVGIKPYDMGQNLTKIELFSPTSAPTSKPITSIPTKSPTKSNALVISKTTYFPFLSSLMILAILIIG